MFSCQRQSLLKNREVSKWYLLPLPTAIESRYLVHNLCNAQRLHYRDSERFRYQFRQLYSLATREATSHKLINAIASGRDGGKNLDGLKQPLPLQISNLVLNVAAGYQGPIQLSSWPQGSPNQPVIAGSFGLSAASLLVMCSWAVSDAPPAIEDRTTAAEHTDSRDPVRDVAEPPPLERPSPETKGDAEGSDTKAYKSREEATICLIRQKLLQEVPP